MAFVFVTFILVHGFHHPYPSHVSIRHHRFVKPQNHKSNYLSPKTSLYQATKVDNELKQDDIPYTIQILMSDTGGGHRASANALRDALDYLYPGKIRCDIVDIFTEYGPFFPFNAFVPIYKIMAEYSFLWKWSYEYGATPFGLWMNELILEVRFNIFVMRIHEIIPHTIILKIMYVVRHFALIRSKNV